MATSMNMLCCVRQFSAKNGALLQRILPLIFVQRDLSSNDSQVAIEELVTEKDYPEEDEIDAICNVSGLSKRNRQRMAHAASMPEINYRFQTSVQYQRRLYAKFGKSSGIDASIMWPTLEELKEKQKLEREWEPSLQDMWAKLEASKKKEQDFIQKRETNIAKNMSQMGKWIEQYHQKIEAKQEEVRKQQEKKRKLLDEAREFFGYEVDPRDAKFQEMVEEKELKRKKEAKAKKKAEQAARLAAQIRMMAEQSRGESRASSVEAETPASPSSTESLSNDTNSVNTLDSSKPEKS